MGRHFFSQTLEWKPVRPDITTEVYGKILLEGPVKIVLTRVGPGGKFASHRDDYGHLFYFLEGKGRVSIEENTFEAVPGLIVDIPAGEMHSYVNDGEEELLLISVNIEKK